MNVIWKRPDGFMGAKPEDYQTLDLGGHSNIWLHKSNQNSYPFRVSGGWEEDKQTRRLNRLVNLLAVEEDQMRTFLEQEFEHSMASDWEGFKAELGSWLGELKNVVKGDTWEVEIIAKALEQVEERVARLSLSDSPRP